MRAGIPSFDDLCKEIKEIFEATIKSAKPGKYGLAACSVQGKVFTQGESQLFFPLFKTSSIFNYLISCEENGEEKLDELLGTEMETHDFTLTADHKPPNPF